MLKLEKKDMKKFSKQTKKIYKKSWLYLWISDKEYSYKHWMNYLITFSNSIFHDIIINWINDEPINVEIENQFTHEKTQFSEIYDFWRKDFITTLWLLLHFYHDNLDFIDLKSSPDAIAIRLWNKKYV